MAAKAKHPAGAPRAAVVFNPKKSNHAALRSAVASAEQAAGWAPSLWFESKPKSSKPIQRAIAAGVELVIVSGGDGSVRRAIADLLEAEIPLAIVPTGTGNLLARNLGLPLNNLPAALAIAFGAHERNLDVLELETVRAAGERRRDVSVVLSGVGIDAAMIANTKSDLKKRFGWIAYIDGVRRSIGQLAPFPVRISIDGRPSRAHRAAAVFIANLADLPGNVSLVPGAALDDGQLDVVVLQPRTVFDWLFIWRRFSWENSVLRKSEFGVQIAETIKGKNRSQVAYKRGRQVDMWLDGDAQPFQIDGDSAGAIRSLSATVNRHGMRIKVPA